MLWEKCREVHTKLMFANVCSLDNKIDYIVLWRASQKSVRDCCVSVFMETWLNQNILNAAIEVEDQHETGQIEWLCLGKGKWLGCVQEIIVPACHGSFHLLLTTHRAVDCEILTKYYLAWELMTVLMTAKYVPPSTTVEKA